MSDTPPPANTPPPESDAPQPADQDNSNQVQNASAEQLIQFVTTIKDVEQQIGEHIIKALQHEQTVAVLTSVVVGLDGRQHIVSAALGPSQMAQVNQLLSTATEYREEETPCVGFHCLLQPKSVGGKQPPQS